MDMWSC